MESRLSAMGNSANPAIVEFTERLRRLESASMRRRIPQSPEPHQPIIDLCSNDYLGLASVPDAIPDDFLTLLNTWHFSSSASRLLSLKQDCHLKLENELESLYSKSVLLFNSGYHANTGCISSLNIPGMLFLADKLIHASVIDGLMLSRSEFYRWRHNDVDHLRRLIHKYGAGKTGIVIVAEGIYSMDGDEAPLNDIVSLKREFPNLLVYLDEAHSFGVRGERGLGLAEETGVLPEIDILIGTFGKACASSGAFAATSPLLKEWLVNNARSFIFSTALPPICSLWSLLMIKKIVTMKSERLKLAWISKDFRNFITSISGMENPSSSQIVPLILGDVSKAVRMGKLLRDAGICALPIRRPTVPPGGERIRFSLNASLKEAELDYVKSQMSSFIEL